jgi:hypothetical protein
VERIRDVVPGAAVTVRHAGLACLDGPGQFTGAPTELPIYRSARNHDDAVRLWVLSEQQAQVTFA